MVLLSTKCKTIPTPMSSKDMMMASPPIVAPEVMLQQLIKIQTPELFEGTKEKVKVFIM